MWKIILLPKKKLRKLRDFPRNIFFSHLFLSATISLYKVHIKSRFHFKYFRNLFLTFMLFLTHFRLLFASYTPWKHRNFCLSKYLVGKGRDHFFWSRLKIFLFKVFNLFCKKFININICMVDFNWHTYSLHSYYNFDLYFMNMSSTLKKVQINK